MKRASCRKAAIGTFIKREYSGRSFALYSWRLPGSLRNTDRVAEELRQEIFLRAGVKKVGIVGKKERYSYEFPISRLTTLGIFARVILLAPRDRLPVTPAGSVTGWRAGVVRIEGVQPNLEKIRATRSWAASKAQAVGYRHGHEEGTKIQALWPFGTWRVLMC